MKQLQRFVGVVVKINITATAEENPPPPRFREEMHNHVISLSPRPLVTRIPESANVRQESSEHERKCTQYMGVVHL